MILFLLCSFLESLKIFPFIDRFPDLGICYASTLENVLALSLAFRKDALQYPSDNHCGSVRCMKTIIVKQILKEGSLMWCLALPERTKFIDKFLVVTRFFVSLSAAAHRIGTPT
jgi:hypothetical protein